MKKKQIIALAAAIVILLALNFVLFFMLVLTSDNIGGKVDTPAETGRSGGIGSFGGDGLGRGRRVIDGKVVEW